MFHRFILRLVPGWPFSKQGLKFFSVYLFICFNKKAGKGALEEGSEAYAPMLTC